MEKISVTTDTKGILVHAVCRFDGCEWLVLINELKSSSFGTRVIRHIAYCITHKREYILKPSSYGCSFWGIVENYNFYKPTEEDKKFFIDLMKKHKKKFISTLNKMIDI